MPILRTSKGLNEGLAETEYKGDGYRFLHVENVDELARANHEMRKDPEASWNKKSGFRLIARVPELAFRAHPELGDPTGKVNKKALRKFLNSDEGYMFRTTDGGI